MKKAMFFSVAIFVVELVLLLILLPLLPATIPIHWNWAGQPDSWAANWTILIVPIINFLPVLSLYFVSCAMTKRNAKNRPTDRALSIGIISTKLVFTLILVSVLIAIGDLQIHFFAIDRVIYAICGIVLIVLGVYLPKINQNSTIGVRTKWTLKSETVWMKTSVLTSLLFAINGCAFLLCQILLPEIYNLVVPLALMVLLIPIILIYSYSIYKAEQKD